ncbi:MAG: chorismate synthase [Nitrospinae bacterium]|nr:chorismate synthase [Nitrospinota bacterium]
MSNTFGRLLRLTSWGESHGPAIGGVLDGCPAGVPLSEQDMQKDLDRRRPGQSAITTKRNEPDAVKILSGVFDGKTTGAPIGFVIDNQDKNSSSYEKIKDVYRPGHADYSMDQKYGFRDWRGGGRTSARETAVRVAAGAVAKKILAGVRITAHTTQIGDVLAVAFNEAEIEKNPVRCADPSSAEKMVALIEKVRKEGDSIGGVVEVVVEGVPAGLGAPVYGKLDADLASAMMGINAVKGVEIGSGFRCASMRGSQNNDQLEVAGGKISFRTNNAGGILGGISNGDKIVVRIAVKPTPSIIVEQDAVDKKMQKTRLTVEGRHDPCICPRVVPVAEAMAALVLADHLLLNRVSKI